MSKNKKILIIMLTIIILLIVILLTLVLTHKETGYYPKIQPIMTRFYATETAKKMERPLKITDKKFNKKNNLDIYYYNIETVSLYPNNEENIIELIENDQLIVDTMLSIFYNNVNDGFATYEKFLEYEKYTYENFSVIVLSTRTDNNDIFFGNKDMKFEDIYQETYNGIEKEGVLATASNTMDIEPRKVTNEDFNKKYHLDIYFYNIESLKTNGGEDIIELLNNKKLNLNNFFYMLNKKVLMQEGSYDKQKAYSVYTFENFSVVQRIFDEDENLYVGPKDMLYSGRFDSEIEVSKRIDLVNIYALELIEEYYGETYTNRLKQNIEKEELEALENAYIKTNEPLETRILYKTRTVANSDIPVSEARQILYLDLIKIYNQEEIPKENNDEITMPTGPKPVSEKNKLLIQSLVEGFSKTYTESQITNEELKIKMQPVLKDREEYLLKQVDINANIYN